MLTEDRKAQQVQRRATLTVAGVVALLALVIAGGVVFFLRDGGSGNPSARPPATPADPAGGASATTVAKATSETLASGTVTWSDFHGLPIPVSPAGPANSSAGRASGFAHSPAGAALAAINIPYRAASSPGPAVFEPTIGEQMVGVDKEKFLASVEAEYAASKSRYGAASDGSITADFDRARRESSRVWAYRVDAYDVSIATVHVLLSTVTVGATTPTYVDLAYTVRWVDGDWRLVAPLNGSWASISTPVRDVPTNYVVVGRS
jgi:hypothetical protein